MADALQTIIISGSDQNKNALKLRLVLEKSDITLGVVETVMLKGNSANDNDEKLSLYVEDSRTAGVCVLTSKDLKRIADEKNETASEGIQISGENVHLKGSKLCKLLEDQKDKVVLVCCENIASIPKCLEDIETSEIITVEPTAKGVVTARKLTDGQVPVMIKNKLSELNARNRPLAFS